MAKEINLEDIIKAITALITAVWTIIQLFAIKQN